MQTRPADKTLVCYPFVGDTIGGSHLSTLALIDNLKQREDDTNIIPMIVLHSEGKLSNYLKARDIDYILLPLSIFVGRHDSIAKKILSFVYTLPKVSLFILRHRVNIIHTNDARMHLTWVLPSLFVAKKHVWHQRTLWHQGKIPDLLVNYSQEIICISNYVKLSMPIRKNKNISVVWNPVRTSVTERSVNEIRHSILERYPKDWNGYVVSTIGNLQAVKQPLLFIEMGLEMIRLSQTDIHFVVVGEDREEYVSRMRKMIKDAGFSDRFSFLGFREDVDEIISASDLVVACSKADAFGRTIIESMSLNTPIVAIDAGGHSEIINNRVNGFLFENDDPIDMAKLSLNILVNKNETRDIVERAKKFSDIHFDDSLHADKVIEIYRR